VKVSLLVAYSLGLFALLLGPVVLLPGTFLEIGLPRSYLLLVAALLIAASFKEKKQDLLESLGVSGIIITILFFLSDLSIRPQSYAQTQFPLGLYLILSVATNYLFSKRIGGTIISLASASVLAGFIGFLTTAKNQLIFTDDHPCFLYRLIQLKENFPKIPFYNPLWNGGVEAREFFASGILNVFTVFSPLIYLFEVESVYNFIVLSLLFLVPPILSFISGRVLKLSNLVIGLHVVISLTSSMLWYRWGLSYGTLGFILSMSFLPLNTILLDKILKEEGSLDFFKCILIASSMSLMFLWSLSILPILLVCAFSLPQVFKALKRRHTWVIFALLLLLNGPWASVFYRASGVADFISGGHSQVQTQKSGMHDESKFKAAPPKERNLPVSEKIKINIYRTTSFASPFVLFFGILSFFFLNKPEVKIFRPLAGALLFLGLFGPLLKPQLELERMWVVLTLVLSWPAAVFISEHLTKSKNLMAKSAIMGALSLSPFWIWQLTTNQTNEKFSLSGDLVEGLKNVIKNESGEGRTLFAGFILHELNEGHVAPLAYWTNKPLIASSYQHDKWKYVDVIPESYRKQKDVGVSKYLDLMNVSLIITHDRHWNKWFSKRPNLFKEIWKEGRFKAFKRIDYKSNYFLSGEGELVNQDGNSFHLKLHSQSAVIKFNYRDFLEANNCEISPHQIDSKTTFIKLDNCRKGEDVLVRSKNIIYRFFR
jgi:hypothetical protein